MKNKVKNVIYSDDDSHDLVHAMQPLLLPSFTIYLEDIENCAVHTSSLLKSDSSE